MLRVHFIQQWLNLSDPAMEEAPSDAPLLRDSACLGGWTDGRPPRTVQAARRQGGLAGHLPLTLRPRHRANQNGVDRAVTRELTR
jgi:hypothetical protein